MYRPEHLDLAYLRRRVAEEGADPAFLKDLMIERSE